MADPLPIDSNTTPTNTTNPSESKDFLSEEEVVNLKECLPKVDFMGNNKFQLINIQGFWYPISRVANIFNFQRHFLAQHTDLIIASFPKTGTTWLKSLLFLVANRHVHSPNQSPLASQSPHVLVCGLETAVYGNSPLAPSPHQLNDLPSPRLLQSHVPYACLPESMKTSSCKIMYISRNPLDTLVSHWHFYSKMMKRVVGDEDYQPPNVEEFFEEFYQGKVFCGPYFEHVLGYWKQSLEQPNKVLFLTYEDLMESPCFYLKKLAEFIDMPFSLQEENDGVIKEIVDFCSINNLKELEINKNGFLSKVLENKTFFREGAVGGWTRYLTGSMVERMNMLMEQKLEGSGLSFKLQL